MTQASIASSPAPLARPLRILLLAGALAGFGGCSSVSYERDGDDYMRQAKFNDALRAYKVALGDGSNERLSHKVYDAYIASKLQEGQRLHFAGELVKANNVFREVAAEQPDNPVVAEWLKKSQRDVSRKLTEMGKESLAVREYDQAIQLFKKALDYDPTNDEAAHSLDRTAKILQWRAEKGELLWREGLRAIHEGYPLIAETNIQNSLEYTPDRADAPDMLSDVKQTIADYRQRLAQSLEDKGQYSAALQQYRLAKNTGNPADTLDNAIQRTSNESKADECVRRADLALAKHDFGTAEKYLEQAKGLTRNTDNLTAIDVRLFQVKEKRVDNDFKMGVLLELEGKLEDAIAQYTAIDQHSPGYRDTRERIDRLKSQIRNSNEEYKAGMQKLEAGDLDGARLKLKAALFLHPFHPDARAQLKKVEDQIRSSKKKDKESSTPASKPQD